jgi:hypothetical protein
MHAQERLTAAAAAAAAVARPGIGGGVRRGLPPASQRLAAEQPIVEPMQPAWCAGSTLNINA